MPPFANSLLEIGKHRLEKIIMEDLKWFWNCGWEERGAEWGDSWWSAHCHPWLLPPSLLLFFLLYHFYFSVFRNAAISADVCFLWSFIFIFLYKMFSLNVCLCTMCIQCLLRSEEGTESLENEVRYDYKLPWGCWELDWAPLEAVHHWATSRAPACSSYSIAQTDIELEILLLEFSGTRMTSICHHS